MAGMSSVLAELQRRKRTGTMMPQHAPVAQKSVSESFPQITGRGAAEAAAATPIPIVSDLAAAGLAADDVRKGNYGTAALNALGVLPFIPALGGIMAGKGAKTADLLKMADAEKRLAAGSDPAAVWRETGWGRGPDGQMRFEIADNKAKVLPDYWIQAQGGKHPTLGNRADDTYIHPALFEAYPELRDINMRVGLNAGLANGAYNNTGAARDLDVFKRSLDYGMQDSTAAHEFSHAVQGVEGFSPGGNPTMFRPLIERADEEIKNANRAMSNYSSRAEHMKALGKKDVADQFHQQYLEAMTRRGELVPVAQMDPMDAYQRIPGEAEARLTQHRLSLDDAARREQYPYDPAYFKDATGVDLSVLRDPPKPGEQFHTEPGWWKKWSTQ